MRTNTSEHNQFCFPKFVPLVGMLALLALDPHRASAQAGPSVIRGQEILVSSIPNDAGIAPKLPPLFLNGEILTMTSPGDGSLAILSMDPAAAPKSDELIPAALDALKARCKLLIERNPRVAMDCEPNLIVRKHVEPDDEYYPQLYNLKQISAPAAWDISTGSKDVVVAVVDSGLDYSHVEISDNVFVNVQEIPFNGLDDDRNGFVDDYFGYDFAYKDSDPRDDDGHGTHVAGIIGAVSNNDVGIAGVAWNVSLLPVKVLNKKGWGNNSAVAAGIHYAVMRGAKVINLSLAGDESSPAIRKAIIAALRKDVVVVASAGNDQKNIDIFPIYPAAMTLDNIISVAATNSSDSFAAGFSNFGPQSVDVAAPGVNILSTWPDNYLSYQTGTSMAAPHVSGIVAIMRGLNPTLSFAETKTIIMNTVDQKPSLAGKVKTAGRVNFARAIKAALYNLRNPPPPSRTISITASRRGVLARISGTVMNQNRTLLVGEWTNLICNGQGMSKVKTRIGGYYEYNFNLARGILYSCFVEDDRGSRSRIAQVRL